MTNPTENPAPSTAESMAPSMAQRYGTGRPPRRGLAIGLGVAVAAALLGWAVWAAWLSGSSGIEATLTSYDVVSTHEIRVKITPHLRGDDVEGTCLVRATAGDHTIVGEVNLTAEELRDAEGSWIPIRTERRATTAAVVRCTE